MMYNLIPEYILDRYLENSREGSFQSAALFMDISGFTAITEHLMTFGREGAEVISDVLEFVFNNPVLAVYQNHGYIASYLGDAFTALFPVEPGFDEHQAAAAALLTAQKIRESFALVFNSRFGAFKFDVKIGLSFGSVDWNIFGQQKKHTYCFSGKAITSCAKGENLAGDGEIWCDEDFRQIASQFMETDQQRGNFSRISSFRKSRQEQEQPFPLNLTKNYPQELIASFAGKHEIKFSKPELRDVSTVYLALEQTDILDSFMSIVFDLCDTWGGSHPHLYYGDKGWNLVVFFGAPIAYGAHPDKALNFIYNLKENLPQNFNLKGGITCGKLFTGFNGAGFRREFTCLGSKVNLACRYMAFAGWHELLCDEETAREPRFVFEFRGKLSFKGNLSYIPTYNFKKLQTDKAESFNYAFVGREEEIKELNGYVKPVFLGSFGGIIYIDGAAGVGKTRLMHEFSSRLSDLSVKRQSSGKSSIRNLSATAETKPSHFFWLHLPCDEIIGRSFHPVIYFLKKYFQISDSQNTDQNRAKFQENFDALFHSLPRGELKEILNSRRIFLENQLIITQNTAKRKQLNGRDFYNNFIYTVKALIKAMSLLKPVIIHLEDAQWIDEETDRFITALTSNPGAFPLIILCSCRYAEDGSKVRLSAKQAVNGRIKLKAFNLRDSFQLAEKIIIKELFKLKKPASSSKAMKIPQNTFEKIWDISEGNPFIIEQLVAYLSENNYLDTDLSLKKRHLELPSTINAVTTARIDKLSPLLKETVKAASVLGREFDIRILAGLIDWDIKEVLTEGHREAIWQPVSDNRFSFAHAILRDCAYQMQLSRQLKELHIKTADLLLEQHYNNPADYYSEIAYHYESGDAVSKAVSYYEQAGDSCMTIFKNSEALVYYNKIIDHYAVWREVKIDSWNIGESSQDNPLLAELEQSLEIYLRNLLKKASILYQIGRWQETEPLCKEIITLSTRISHTAYAAKGYKYLGRYYHTAADDNQAMKNYKKARKLYQNINDIDGIISVLTYLGDCCEKRKELKKASSFYRYQLKLAKMHKHKKGLADAYWKIGNINLIYGRYKAAINYYQLKLALSEELNDKLGISIALNNLALIYTNLNENEKALALYERQLKIAKDISSMSSISLAYKNYSQLLFKLDRKAEAEDYIDKALLIDNELNIHSSLMVSTLLKGQLLFYQKQYSKAFIYAQEALHHSRIAGNPDFIRDSSNMLKKINFQLLKNRKTKADYLNNLLLEIENEPDSEQKILDFILLLEMHAIIGYRVKTLFKTYTELLERIPLKTSRRDYFTAEAERIVNR